MGLVVRNITLPMKSLTPMFKTPTSVQNQLCSPAGNLSTFLEDKLQ